MTLCLFFKKCIVTWMPKLSVITINYNNLTGLQKTMHSVFQQTFKDYEFIIIDGGSTDGSKELMETHAHKLTYCVSEKDNGIYNAMNKGIAKSSGKYLLFLNSGDYLFSDNVLSIWNETNTEEDITYGDVMWDTKGILENGHFPDRVSFNFFRGNSLPHQASFISRNLFATIGLYDESLSILADWKFFLLAVCKYNYSYKHIPVVISVCGRDGISCDPANYVQMAKDRTNVLGEYFAAFMDDYAVQAEQKNELMKVKRMLGYRMHKKLKKILFKIGIVK